MRPCNADGLQVRARVTFTTPIFSIALLMPSRITISVALHEPPRSVAEQIERNAAWRGESRRPPLPPRRRWARRGPSISRSAADQEKLHDSGQANGRALAQTLHGTRFPDSHVLFRRCQIGANSMPPSAIFRDAWWHHARGNAASFLTGRLSTMVRDIVVR